MRGREGGGGGRVGRGQEGGGVGGGGEGENGRRKEGKHELSYHYHTPATPLPHPPVSPPH